MAKGGRFRRKRAPALLDEFGGSADGALAILASDGTQVHMTPSRVAASLRFFVARVQLHDAQGIPERIALTSALSGEGVTYTTRSLAAVMAYDMQLSVAVVDFNWRRPASPAENGGERELGVADVVEQGIPVEDVMVATSNPRLWLIPPGEIPISRRPALAMSDDLITVLDQLDDRFDHLLLDLPPVLATSEAMNLSQLADAYVLVVRQGVTSESQVEAALEELQGSQTLGVILNRFHSDIPRRLRRLVGT
jgi:Mrp family chromosome partitioning ATPase